MFNFYDLMAIVGCWSSVSIRRIIYKLLNVCHFDYTAFVFSEKVNYTIIHSAVVDTSVDTKFNKFEFIKFL